MNGNVRIGFGYDVHAFVVGRPLILGGVTIPYARGLDGHSDADVVVHALCDAMLGALALGDIGQHFPSTDERWHGVSSLRFLEHVTCLMCAEGYRLGNADITIVAQQPRLASHVASMAQRLATTVGVSIGQISVKATTTDGLGFVGKTQGIAAYAVCLCVAQCPEDVRGDAS
ncbi:MAG: 2-C-methyl-D-erythritol 2,4-cyclodiphosphate synthase [Candidatus Tectimicrobiota bacterium]